jgi:MFS family permease
MVLETKGVGTGLSGTALGMTFTIAQIGSVISPPIGNSLDVYGNQWPFIFWAAAGAAALIPFMLTSETGKRKLKKLKL